MPHPDTLCREEVESATAMGEHRDTITVPDAIMKEARVVAEKALEDEYDHVRACDIDMVIARALLAEREAQRERDARIAKRYGAFEVENDFGAGYKRASLNIADAIRDGGDHA